MNHTTQKDSLLNQPYSLGLIGARGYVGQTLLRLLESHQSIDVSWVSSRQLAGQPATVLAKHLEALQIEDLTPQQVAERPTDIIVLALPNGLAAPYVAALENNEQVKVIIDLSADYRFDENWQYSLPEIDTLKAANPSKISNPGCYATAMQLAIAPLKSMIEGMPHCFGVSGYSGAGTKPSANNDPAVLQDNLVGYAPVDHLHEKEVSHRMASPVRFSPHVAAFFSGINMTIQVTFKQPQTAAGLFDLFDSFYADSPLVFSQAAVPTVQQVKNTPLALLGGFAVSENGLQGTLTCCLDNLYKGAASQALQNINLAVGLPELEGIEHQPPKSPLQEKPS